MSRFDATENCGFTANGDGFVRVWLANDDPETAGRDLWVRDGQFYPLNLLAYEFVDDGGQHPNGLVLTPGNSLGGYTRSFDLDETSGSLVENIGFYVLGSGAVRAKRRNLTKYYEVILSAGDFYAGDVEAIELVVDSGISYVVFIMDGDYPEPS